MSVSRIMDRLSAITSRNTIARLLVAILMLAPAAFALEPEIEIAIGQDEVFVGDAIDLQIEIRNSKNPSPPDLAPLKEQFDVTVGADESRNQSATFIVNGRISKQEVFSHIYHYRLTPKSAGQITIPELTATVDGKTLTTSARNIRVVEPEEQDNVVVEVETSHQRVYPTQPFEVTARILIKPLPNDELPSSLLLPMGRMGPAFLAYPNFAAYTEWNNSLIYSTTAGYLATRIAGAPPMRRPSGTIAQLPFNEIKELQGLLVRAGFTVGKVDGVLGQQSRSAIKAMQIKYGLPADSWPTAELLARMRGGPQPTATAMPAAR